MIEQMKKVSIVLLNKEKENAIKALRKIGLLHLEKIEGSSEKLNAFKEYTNNAVVSESILGEIKLPKQKKGTAATLEDEKVISLCDISESQKQSELSIIAKEQRRARRVLCFCHKLDNKTFYDGFVTLIDPIRDNVKKAVKHCKNAGINVKVLTGDNFLTAFAIAEELNIVSSEYEVVNASELENMDDNSLKRALPKIKVIARSTPLIKMRVVNSVICLKDCSSERSKSDSSDLMKLSAKSV